MYTFEEIKNMDINDSREIIFKLTNKRMVFLPTIDSTQELTDTVKTFIDYSDRVINNDEIIFMDLTENEIYYKDNYIIVSNKKFPLLPDESINVEYIKLKDSILVAVSANYSRIYYTVLVKLDDPEKFINIVELCNSL